MYDADLLLVCSTHAHEALFVAKGRGGRVIGTKHAASLTFKAVLLGCGTSHSVSGPLCLDKNLGVHDLVYRESLHLVEVLAHSVVVVPLQQILQRDEWFASISGRLGEVNRLSDA